jgi:hypothetical protein
MISASVVSQPAARPEKKREEVKNHGKCNVAQPAIHASAALMRKNSYLEHIDYDDFVRLSEVDLVRVSNQRCRLFDHVAAVEGVVVADRWSDRILPSS